MGLEGARWDLRGLARAPRDLGIEETRWDSVGLNGVRWDSMGFDGGVGGRSVVRWVRVYYLALSSVPAVFCVNEYGNPFSYAGLCMGGLGSVCFLGAILPCGWGSSAFVCLSFVYCVSRDFGGRRAGCGG